MSMNRSNLLGTKAFLELDAENAEVRTFLNNAAIHLISSWEMVLSLRSKGGLPEEIEKYLQGLEGLTRKLISDWYLIKTTESIKVAQQDMRIGLENTNSNTRSKGKSPKNGGRKKNDK